MPTPALNVVLRSETLDPIVVSYIERRLSAGLPAPSPDRRRAWNSLARTIRNEVGLENIGQLLLLVGVDSLDGCLIPFIRVGTETVINNNFVSADYNDLGTSGGLLGNGTTKWLTLGVNAQTYINTSSWHSLGAISVAGPSSFRGIGPSADNGSPGGTALSTSNTRNLEFSTRPSGLLSGPGGSIPPYFGGIAIGRRDATTTYIDTFGEWTVSNSAVGSFATGLNMTLSLFSQQSFGSGIYDGRIAVSSFGRYMNNDRMLAYCRAIWDYMNHCGCANWPRP